MKQVAVILARQSRLKPRPVAGFFVCGHLGLVVRTFTLLEDTVLFV